MTIEDKRLRPLLPECVPAQRTPAPARPVRRKTEGFVRDEYDTVILADLVKCTV